MSRDGRYLAVASVEGDIVVWEWSSGKCTAKLRHAQGTIICSVVWHPAFHDQLVYCDIEVRARLHSHSLFLVCPEKRNREQKASYVISDTFIVNSFIV